MPLVSGAFAMPFLIKRIYEPPQPTDGTRVLVDRLWPRGVSKTAARLDHWMKNVAPSVPLRVWFGHIPAKFPEFRRKYKSELSGNTDVRELRTLGRGKRVTLLYAARDPKINHAQVLLSVLERGASATKPRSRPARGSKRP
jgi:uncharacterized protein YeaO (DUF488 family)